MFSKGLSVLDNNTNLCQMNGFMIPFIRWINLAIEYKHRKWEKKNCKNQFVFALKRFIKVLADVELSTESKVKLRHATLNRAAWYVIEAHADVISILEHLHVKAYHDTRERLGGSLDLVAVEGTARSFFQVHSRGK